MTIYTVTFRADNGLHLEVMAGDGVAKITGGFANWDTVDRPRRVGMTRYTGRSPFTQDIPLRFDGYAKEISQEPFINILQRMAQPGTDGSEPPKIKLGGIAHRKDLTWVITGIDEEDGAVWVTKGGSPVRIRQDIVVHLSQFVDDSVLTTAASPAQSAQTAKKKVKITTPKGMTLKQIVLLEYPHNVTKGMMLILNANQFLDPNPRKEIPQGTPLTIPDINTGVGQEFIVP